MAKRSFVMLAHKYNPQRDHVGNWFISDKLDGIRALWDGGLSIGLPTSQIPWANTEKDLRLREAPVSTGLWTRLGHVIHAPSWFLNLLPDYPLDGELHCPTGSWQTLSSIIKKFDPLDEDWYKIIYSVFDSPPTMNMFADGVINETNFKKTFIDIDAWVKERSKKVSFNPFVGQQSFIFVYEKLLHRLTDNQIVKVHPQIIVPNTNYKDFINNELEAAVKRGREGIMLRAPMSVWFPERSHCLLKYKPFLDDEAIVTGYVFGRKTDLGSKLLGLMGALITNYKGKRLELSGFTDEERILVSDDNTINISGIGELLAGKQVPSEIYNPKFRRGSAVTFRYRELSDNGIPKEARFLRRPI